MAQRRPVARADAFMIPPALPRARARSPQCGPVCALPPPGPPSLHFFLAASALEYPPMAALAAGLPEASDRAVAALAPTGVLRAGINLSNFLLVTGTSDVGRPVGVSPDMAAALALKLNAVLEYITYASPGQLADAVEEGAWDIANIGAEPARAARIAFTRAYCEIESTCLVRAESSIQTFSDVDQPGVRIATKHRAAYSLWLERNLEHAELVQVESIDAAFDAFVDLKLDVLAGLRPRLLTDAERLPGTRILADRFTAVQQAIGAPRERDAVGAEYLERFVIAATESGFVSGLIEHHGVAGKLSLP